MASGIFDRDGPAAAYRAVHASLQKLGNSSVSSSEIKLIGPKNPIARDVLAVMGHYPDRLATKQSFAIFGGLTVDQQYIYPPQFFTFNQAKPMTSEDIGREVLQLMNRGAGLLQPSRVTLKDGTAFNGVPFALELGTQRAVVARFMADGEAVPRVVRLDEVASTS